MLMLSALVSALVPSLLMSEAELAQNADVCLFMLCNVVSSGVCSSCANSGYCLVCGLDSVTLPVIVWILLQCCQLSMMLSMLSMNWLLVCMSAAGWCLLAV